MSTQALTGASFDTYAYADPFLAQMEGGTGVAYGTDNAATVQDEANVGSQAVAIALPFGLGGSPATSSDGTPINNATNGNDAKCAMWKGLGITFPGCNPDGTSSIGTSEGDPIMLILIGLLAIVLIGVGVWSLVK
jgi:hypothetical protein